MSVQKDLKIPFQVFSDVSKGVGIKFDIYADAQKTLKIPFQVFSDVSKGVKTTFHILEEVQQEVKLPFHLYGGVTKGLKTPFHVIGSIIGKRFYPADHEIPRPGQWVYVKSPRYGISDYTLCKVTNVTESFQAPGLYEVKVEISRMSLKEDILFAELQRKQVDLIEEDADVLETLNFYEELERSETLTLTVIPADPAYSGVNRTNGEYSGAV